MPESINILKTKGENEQLRLVFDAGKFTCAVGQKCPSWMENSDGVELSDIRSQVEPWLTSLFQSEHLSLLVGTGLSYSLEHMATGKAGNAMIKPELEGFEYANQVDSAAQQASYKNNRGFANIEDYIRVLNDLLHGLEIIGDERKDRTESIIKEIITGFAESICELERNIITSEENIKEETFTYLVNFLMSFASRTGTRERLNIFTTNYDRLIEAGADLAGLHLLDRFIGNLSPIFRSSRLDIDMHYSPPGIRGEPRYLEGVARFTKLHGSLDWVNIDNDIHTSSIPANK